MTNSLLFRFLSAATIVFLFVVVITYIQQNKQVVPVAIAPVNHEKGFSDFATSSDHTAAYAFNAKVVNDIETYPELKSLFFSSATNFLKDKSDKDNALIRLKSEQKESTDFSDRHVYNTSFYVGNLLVLPDLTLHELLLKKERPQTAILLETALADVRAGVVKIQDYFNQPTASQLDSTVVSQLYFSTPSFPNLTTAEALTVLYLLADVDVKNSRLYEMHARQYINHVLVSGGVFDYDVEYAMHLVSAYHQIFLNNEYYQELISKAKAEWLNSELATGTLYILPKIEIPDFPYQSVFTITDQLNTGYQVEEEEFGGSLMLSLVDKRLPDLNSTLYQYSFASGNLLPFALDINKRKFPVIGNNLYMASYFDKDNYVFTSNSDTNSTDIKSLPEATSSIFYYHKGELSKLNTGDDLVRTNPKLSRDADKIVWSQKKAGTNEEWEVTKSDLKGNEFANEEILTTGSFPGFAFKDKGVVFLNGSKILYYDFASQAEKLVADLNIKIDKYNTVKLDYFADKDLAIARVETFDQTALLPVVKVYVYKLNNVAGEVTGPLVYKVTLQDVQVASLYLSPGGSYLAMAVTETESKRSARLLLFDIMYGKTKTEIPLTPFQVDHLHIDEWTLFD